MANISLHAFVFEPYTWYHSVPKRLFVAVLVETRACLPRDARYPRCARRRHVTDSVRSMLSPLYVLVSPVARAVRYKPCPVVLVPGLGLSRPPGRYLDLLRSALRTYNARIYIHGVCFELKIVLTFPEYVQLSRMKTNTGSPRRFRSFLTELGPARCEIAGFTTCALRRTYPCRNLWPERAIVFQAPRAQPDFRR